MGGASPALPCVILAGGLGTRMRHVAPDLPKFLLPVAGRPFADHQLAWLAGQGVRSVVLCVGYRAAAVADHVGDGSRWGLAVRVVDEGPALRGTGGALRHALDAGALPERFWALYGDSYLPIDLAPVQRAFERSGAEALMTVLHNEDRWDRSNARLDGGLVVRYEKGHSDPAAAGLRHVDYGLSILGAGVVAELVPAGVPFDLADVFRRLSAEGRLAGHEVAERFYEVGSPAGLRDLTDHLAGR
ncbi:MAG TPA: nucleotidyltransferase family protein [Acidimicrobiales bacterium]|nr:nucleotidyltransferase family protein [Acidimicrobiales bacterium]